MTKPEICRCIKTKPHRKEFHERKAKPRGPLTADIMFVGMFPGMDEAIEGLYFVGASGQQIKKDCVAAGIAWSECRIQNIAQYWPRGHNYKSLTEKQREEGMEALLEDIRRVEPKVIVPLGSEPLKALTDHARITAWRGSILELSERFDNLPPATVIPTMHPAAVLRDWDYHTLVMKDLNKIAAFVRGEDVSPRERTLITKNDEEYDEACEYFMAKAAEGVRLAADIEVYQGSLACISFADSPDYAVSVVGEDRKVWQSIIESDCELIWHNSMYDLTFLEAKEGTKAGGIQHDTMHLWHAYRPSLACSNAVGRSLAVLVSLFTNDNYYKDTIDDWKRIADWDALYEYNARDAAVTLEVFDALYGRVEKEDLLDVYNFEMALVEPYKTTSIRGVKIDTKTKGIKAAQTKKELNAVEEKLKDLAGDDTFNPRSWQQVKAVLQDLGIKNVKSTSKKALTRFMTRQKTPEKAREFARIMLRHRDLQKAYGTYYTFGHDDDGRVRTSWIIPGTETGRMANRKGIIFKGGVNMMTIPRPARKFFVADKGYKLLYADLGQAEARIVAWLAGCERLIETFESEYDNYKRVATWMFNKEYEDVTYEERYLAKRCVLGLLYGMGPYEWMQQVNIDQGKNYMSLTRARELHELFFDIFPEIKDYHRWCEKVVRRTRVMHTLGPVTRKRVFRPRNGRFTDHNYREAYDYPPQGTVPDIINTGVLTLFPYEPEIVLHGQIHDAWFGQVRGGDLDLARKVVEALTIPLEITDVKGVTRNLTIPVDVQIGDNWLEYDKEDNPNGLKEVDLG